MQGRHHFTPSTSNGVALLISFISKLVAKHAECCNFVKMTMCLLCDIVNFRMHCPHVSYIGINFHGGYIK